MLKELVCGCKWFPAICFLKCDTPSLFPSSHTKEAQDSTY